MIKLVPKKPKTLSALALKLTRSSWKNMKQRCKEEGIFLDQEFEEFPSFLAWMGARTSAKFTIDRKDYDGPYSPANCRWASRQQQNLNRRNAVKITFNGETLPLIAWASRLKVPAATLRGRKKRGWSDAEIVTGSRAGARKPSADWPWPAGDEQQWEKAYKDHGRNGEIREKFLVRVYEDRLSKMFKYMALPREPIGEGEHGEPIFEAPSPGFMAELERVKRLLADAKLKVAAAARRAADPFAELFRS